MTSLFVYGTLRRNGQAEELMRQCKLVKKGVKISGYSIYDYGEYPFAIITGESDFIIGDVYDVTTEQLKILDEYEGRMYKRVIDLKTKLTLFVKEDNKAQYFPRIWSGDWFNKTVKTSEKNER
jgi:gamma-glutamylcyclotransferase (GGCT)/AIG2-like uncharacterized protein YtfP